jgi:predicted ABC-type ATPase
LRSPFDRRPIVIAIAGPNGAGKSTFFRAHLAASGLLFVNADVLARELGAEPYSAAAAADALRRELLRQAASFAFETVFSDPVGAKLSFLREAVQAGYEVVLCFIGVSGPQVCEQRVAMRVSQGGHDVPQEKILERYPRTLANLREAIRELPHVLVYDNDDLARPFRKVAEFEAGRVTFRADSVPVWLAASMRGA